MNVTSCLLCFSDHCPVYIVIHFNDDSIRGPGVWKFNTRHLRNKEYVNFINNILDKAPQKYINCDPCQCWEYIKQNMISEPLRKIFQKPLL